MKKIGILGCGWLGERIAISLLENGYTVIVSNSSSYKQEELNAKGIPSTVLKFSNQKLMDFSVEYLSAKRDFEQCDSIIISIPLSKKDNESNTFLFENSIRFLSNGTRQQLFFFNSTQIYPSTNTIVDESFKNNLLLNNPFYKVEVQLQKAFPLINILRLGGLFGDDRVFMKYFSGKVLQNGQLPVNHIHYKDICSILNQMIEKNSNQMLFNLVAPLHPSKEEIIKNQRTRYTYENPIKIDSLPIPYKIVSSEKLVRELDYTFLFPNPEFF